MFSPDHFHQLHDMCRVKKVQSRHPVRISEGFLDGCDGEVRYCWHRCNPAVDTCQLTKEVDLGLGLFDDGFNHQVCPAAVDIRR